MAFYTWLKPKPHDDAQTLETKKRATRKLRELRAALRTHIEEQEEVGEVPYPEDPTRRMRLATWNIREFDSSSYGQRSAEAKSYIAEILGHFDLIAIQEVRRDLSALRDVIHLLGPSWTFLATDVTAGARGNKERLVFVYNTKRVMFRDLVGEVTLPAGKTIRDPLGERFEIEGGPLLELPEGEALSLPPELESADGSKLKKVVEVTLPEGTWVQLPAQTTVQFSKGAKIDAADIEVEGNFVQLPKAARVRLPEGSLVSEPMQFARTPFIASFQAGWLKINLCTVHIIYGGDDDEGIEQRNREIRSMTKALADKAKSDNDSDADAYFIALGDFNIVGRDHGTMDSLTTNDFVVPKALHGIPGSNVKQDKAYDQIAVWMGQSKRRKTYTRLEVHKAGVFDFYDTVFRTDEEEIYRPFMKKADGSQYKSYGMWRTYQMSDHLPMWVELCVDFGDEYLESVEGLLDSAIEDAG